MESSDHQFSRSASKEEEEWKSDTNTSCHEWISLTGESKRKVLKMKDIPANSSEVMGGTMCSESNHLSPNDFFSLLASGILRILKIYTAYCLMNHHPRMLQINSTKRPNNGFNSS
ncbi:hypothetical protein EMCRGX_G007589 [Ephydatia muelleri]